MQINEEKIFTNILQAFALSILTFGVSYLRNIGLETAKLNMSVVQLKYEIRSLSDNQGNVNKSLTDKIDLHERRLILIEKKGFIK